MPMTNDEIERVVDDVLESLNLQTSLPIDPLHIAQEEEIALLPGRYDNCFDGRIEYRRTDGQGDFYLFYAQEEPPFRTAGRVRFSIAHELGHFYLPPHREYLLSGQWHSSTSDFTSKKEREREADRFAAYLLMPRDLFQDEVSACSGGNCTLDDLSRLARDAFETSLTSTIIRYIELDFEPCCMVISEGGKVVTSLASEALRTRGMGWIERGGKVPTQSVTARSLTAGKLSAENPKAGGSVDSSVWFNSRSSCDLWEDVVLLSNFGRVITFLTPESNDDDRYDD
ncbi:MAG TPA: ImmA/IrrE family metallo-endopeptidase [Tepidisphaeraceae bacterium]|nr:ImmA/IrrE family metallo-endopeptidase [Tepidisphaeraceae bacterium]